MDRKGKIKRMTRAKRRIRGRENFIWAENQNQKKRGDQKAYVCVCRFSCIHTVFEFIMS